MTENELLNEAEEMAEGTAGRRVFLARAAAAGLGVAALGLAGKAEAAMKPKQPEADTGHDYPMARPNTMTEKQFRLLLSGPAKLSLLTSQIAVDKATDPATREFANFELREAIGVSTVLKNLKTPIPQLDAKASATLQKLKSLPKGAEFDKAYIKAQLANHEYLRDMADSYLKNSEGRTSMAELNVRNIATLTLGAFKEHVVHCKNILRMMK